MLNKVKHEKRFEWKRFVVTMANESHAVHRCMTARRLSLDYEIEKRHIHMAWNENISFEVFETPLPTGVTPQPSETTSKCDETSLLVDLKVKCKNKSKKKSQTKKVTRKNFRDYVKKYGRYKQYVKVAFTASWVTGCTLLMICLL